MIDLNGPNVKIKPPGPKSKELLELKEKYVAKGVSVAHPVLVDKAHGVYVQDVDGNVYIDFAGGIGVLNAGHTPVEVVEAIKEQSEKLLHTCFMVLAYEPYLRLAEKMYEVTPEGLDKTVFSTAVQKLLRMQLRSQFTILESKALSHLITHFMGVLEQL